MFLQFFNIIIYVKIVGKISDQHLNVLLFSNQGDKVQKDGELRDKSVPYFQQESGPFSLDWRMSIHLNVDLVFTKILTYMIMLENCQNNISVYYNCSPI